MKKSTEVWQTVLVGLNEAQRRWVAGAKAIELGWGGVTKVRELTGLSSDTIIRGVREVRAKVPQQAGVHIRHPGGGRKPIVEVEPVIPRTLQNLVDDSTAGDPTGPLRWTHKSTRTLAAELSRKGSRTSHVTVARLLEQLGYSLQVNAKSREGRSPPERDAQFRYINAQVRKFQREGNPVLSVDTKKKEHIGSFKNAGQTWRPKGKPYEVNIYDFPSLAEGTAIPYGAYDVTRNQGFVNVGITYDTAEFAVESLGWWWRRYGHRWYPNATGWLVCADCGGSNGARNRAWKWHLNELARELGIPVTVCHYPPGTSKWNKIEHRMFSYISMNWRGKPLESYETVINLIGGTRTKTGLRVHARLDTKSYLRGEKISEEMMARVHIQPHEVHPQWNYTIAPGSPSN